MRTFLPLEMFDTQRPSSIWWHFGSLLVRGINGALRDSFKLWKDSQLLVERTLSASSCCAASWGKPRKRDSQYWIARSNGEFILVLLMVSIDFFLLRRCQEILASLYGTCICGLVVFARCLTLYKLCKWQQCQNLCDNNRLLNPECLVGSRENGNGFRWKRFFRMVVTVSVWTEYDDHNEDLLMGKSVVWDTLYLISSWKGANFVFVFGVKQVERKIIQPTSEWDTPTASLGASNRCQKCMTTGTNIISSSKISCTRTTFIGTGSVPNL